MPRRLESALLQWDPLSRVAFFGGVAALSTLAGLLVHSLEGSINEALLVGLAVFVVLTAGLDWSRHHVIKVTTSRAFESRRYPGTGWLAVIVSLGGAMLYFGGLIPIWGLPGIVALASGVAWGTRWVTTRLSRTSPPKSAQ
jgi:hypothetical protein